MDLEGFFSHKPTRPTQTVCSEVHVWGMHTAINPSRTVFSTAVCASAYVRLVVLATSALLFHSDSRTFRTDLRQLCGALCNRWYFVVCWCSKEQVLSALHSDASLCLSCALFTFSLLRSSEKGVVQYTKMLQCFVILYNKLWQSY